MRMYAAEDAITAGTTSSNRLWSAIASSAAPKPTDSVGLTRPFRMQVRPQASPVRPA